MNLIKKIIIAFSAIFVLAQLSFAQLQSVSGTGECPIEKSMWSSSPNAKEESFALEKAKEDAFLSYASNLSTSEKALFESQRQQFIYNINDYIRDVKVVAKRKNASKTIYYVDILAKVDAGKVKDEIRKSFNSSQSLGGAMQDGGYVLFFACRKVSEHTSFDENVTKINKSNSAKSFSQGVEDDGDTMVATEGEENMTSTQRGGSTTRKSDKENLVSDESVASEFSAALTGNILDMIADAYIVDGAFFESNEVFQSVYGEGRAMNASTWKSIMAETREDPDIKYAILGTLTFSAKRVENTTGKDTQEATVTAAIYDISKRTPRMIVALEPVTLKGIGNSQSAAQKDALLRSASTGAKEIVNKLMLKMTK